MSIERTVEPWREMQRHGLVIAERFTRGFSRHIHSPLNHFSFHWPYSDSKITNPFDAKPILDIGIRLSEFGASLNNVVQQFFRYFPAPFWHLAGGLDRNSPSSSLISEIVVKRSRDSEEIALASDHVWAYEDGFDSTVSGHFRRPQGSINITSTYDSRTNDVQSSLVARGDFWRVEASHAAGGSTSGSENSPHFVIQMGPLLLVRHSTLLLPVHISTNHLLWYGYDRKNGLHSLCPALWSGNKRWLYMSMICLNPVACSFMDLQFPNGQLTYIAGEGFTHSAFLPAFGGLLQTQGHFPGETRLSFSCKSKYGTQITPMVQWPEKAFSLGLAQTLAWKRSGLMVLPSFRLSMCPTFGGSNSGLHSELILSLKEKLSISCGFSCATLSSAFASLAIGRSKWNGNIGSSGIVVRLEAPLNGVARPSLSIQLNSAVEL